MKKTNEQRIKETENVAISIVAFFDEKPVFRSVNLTEFKEELRIKASERKISIYKDIVSAYLDKKGCLYFDSKGCSIKAKYTKDEIRDLIMEWKDKNLDKKPKSEQNQTGIRRKINRTEQNTANKLQPLSKVLSKLTIKQLLMDREINEVMNYYRSIGCEISCKRTETKVVEY